MCGRFTQKYTWSEVHTFLNVFGTSLNLRPRYNIAPTTTVDVVRLDAQGRRELVSMRWGPRAHVVAEALKSVPATFNARAEGIATKPMFRDAFKRRCCIVPASGFYEWTGSKGDKTPHLFSAADGSPILAFAGLWERWKNPEGEDVLSCTIIVSGASAWMVPYHDRMPVLLGEADFATWLSGEAGPEILRPAAESALREWTVDRRVNRTGEGDDDPTIVEPLAVVG